MIHLPSFTILVDKSLQPSRLHSLALTHLFLVFQPSTSCAPSPASLLAPTLSILNHTLRFKISECLTFTHLVRTV